jgi:cytochrome c
MVHHNLKSLLPIIALFLCSFFVMGCSGGGSSDSTGSNGGGNTAASSEDKAQAMIDKGLGIGPVKEMDIPDKIDKEMAAEGKKLFEQNCTACHKPLEDHLAPAPVGVLDRRKPEWIMNMILNPQEMVQKDPTAQKLQAEYNNIMSQQISKRDNARKIVEYFRTLEK